MESLPRPPLDELYTTRVRCWVVSFQFLKWEGVEKCICQAKLKLMTIGTKKIYIYLITFFRYSERSKEQCSEKTRSKEPVPMDFVEFSDIYLKRSSFFFGKNVLELCSFFRGKMNDFFVSLFLTIHFFSQYNFRIFLNTKKKT